MVGVFFFKVLYMLTYLKGKERKELIQNKFGGGGVVDSLIIVRYKNAAKKQGAK